MFTGRSCETLNVIALNGKVSGNAEYESTLNPESTATTDMYGVKARTGFDTMTYVDATTNYDPTIGYHTTKNYTTTGSHTKGFDSTHDSIATNNYDVTTGFDSPNNNNVTTDYDVTMQYNAASSITPIANISDSYGDPDIITNGLYKDNLTVVCHEGHYTKETKVDTFWAICQHNGTWSYDICIRELGILILYEFINILLISLLINML